MTTKTTIGKQLTYTILWIWPSCLISKFAVLQSVDDLAGTFEIHAHQYVSTLRNPGRDSNSAVAL